MAPEATRVTSPSQSSGRPSMASRLSTKQEDDNQRRSQPAPRAWGPGVNPITQKFAVNSQSNGVVNKGNGRSPVADAASSFDKFSGDNHTVILSQSMGQLCTLITKEGAIFVGTLAAVKARQAETLLLCRMVRTGTQNDVKAPQKNTPQRQLVGSGPDHIVVFPSSQITAVIPSNLSKVSRASAGRGFMTDTQISGNTAFRERKLERWQAPADSSLTLGHTDASGQWDQFKVNQEKFGVKSDYDESQYTTIIDKKSPLYAMREREAARIAAEIEGDARSSTFTDQRPPNDDGLDEEDLYSGVRRNPTPLSSGQPNRYVPPSRRSQQQTPTTNKDALSDPAIISAQVARKDPSKDTKTASSEAATPQVSGPSTDEAKPSALTKDESIVPSAAATVTSATASSATKIAAVPGPTQTQIGLGPSPRGLPDVRTAFKNFANIEKLKVQDNKRRQASHDKAVKVNDLKKFAKNFKLNTPVPKDLLPILAKDEGKQNEIVKKAQEQVDLTKQVKIQPDQKLAVESSVAATRKQTEPPVPGAPSGPANMTGGNNRLAQRLETTRQAHQKSIAQNAMTPTSPIPGPRSKPGSFSGGISGVASPVHAGTRAAAITAEKKLSAVANVFVPNAMAPTFKPVGNTAVSSPSTKPASTRPITPNMPQPKFLREAKARDTKGIKVKPITAQIDEAKKLKVREEKANEASQGTAQSGKGKESASGKLGPPFRERVDWLDNSQTGKEHLLPGYKDSFAAKSRSTRNVSHPTSPGGAGRGPYPGHYMGNGMHGVPHMGPPHMAPPHMQPQPHYPPGGHYEDPHMRPAPSMSGYPAPSPRPGNVYPSPVPHGPMTFHQGGYMPPNAHGMPPRQYSNGPGGMPGPHMQPPMMVPQHSTGPYMQQPMMPIQHGPPYQVTQQMYPGPPQPNGFPSPNRAPPMMPSGSHQGPGPGPVYTPNSQYATPAYHHHPPGPMGARGNFNGQHHYPQSPYQQQQQQPYPARTPSHGYAPPPHQTPTAPAQATPVQPAAKTGEEAK